MTTAIADAARVVVKVGSSSLTSVAGGLDAARLDSLADAIAVRRRAGSDVVLVSSGAIAAGLAPLALARRPRDLATQQAAASVGQLLLVGAYARSFARHHITVGQVLLTAEDLLRRSQYRNARRSLDRLLGLGVVPVVNENDTVATDEIRFGDNDRLAALVAHLVGARLLVLLSDVDGLYTDDPRRPGSRRIAVVSDESQLESVRSDRTGVAGLGSGGMASKLQAARIATGQGIPVLLAAADDAGRALAGEEIGTVFTPTGSRSRSRLFWLEHATAPRGELLLDAGAVSAVVQRRASLLAAGITDVRGRFAAGDPVDLVGPDGAVVGRGLVNYGADELPGLLGRSSADLDAAHRREVVHADDLAVL